MQQPIRFANRSVEIAKFRGFVTASNPRKRLIVFRAEKSSGVSEFLRHLAISKEGPEISIYMDMRRLVGLMTVEIEAIGAAP